MNLLRPIAILAGFALLASSASAQLSLTPPAAQPPQSKPAAKKEAAKEPSTETPKQPSKEAPKPKAAASSGSGTRSGFTA